MAHRVENGLSDDRLIERRYLAHDHAILVMVQVVAQVDLVPQFVTEEEEALTILLTLLVGDAGLVGAVFEDHLRLRQELAERSACAKEDQGRVGQTVVGQQLGVSEQLLVFQTIQCAVP